MSVSTVHLGRTGLAVSRLALGTMTFGLQSDEELAFRILDTAVSGGINFLDTADVYPAGGDLTTVGRTEEIIGRWLKGRRANCILATKAGGKMGPNPWDKGSSRKHLLDAIDASLRRLQTDYVDLYQLHFDDFDTPLDETLEALDVIVKSGRARYIGVSNMLAYRLATALGRADLKGLTRFVSIQPRYNLLSRNIEREILPGAASEGLGVIPYNPLAGGLLTGKHRGGAALTEATRFTVGTIGAIYQDRYWNDHTFTTVEQIVRLADEAGVAPAILSIAWVLANPAVTSVLLGASRPDQLTANLAAADYRLDADLKEKLDQLTSEYRNVDPIS